MKLVNSPVRSFRWRLAATILCATVSMSCKRVAPQILQLKLKSAEASNAADRGRFEGHYDRARNAKKFRRDPRHNVTGGMAFAFAVIDGLQRSKYQPVVRRTPARERKPRNSEGPENIGIGQQNLFRLR